MTLVLALPGACTITPSTDVPPPATTVSVPNVPFFPQAQYQCGPAALATMLVFSGVDTSPEALRDAVYLPVRQGSLQPEIMAATRRSGRIPFTLKNEVSALEQELRAGHPVLILQNLGVRRWPRWHYAVVVAADAGREHWVLRSGRERERVERHGNFIRHWEGGGRWAMVALPPGELPVSVDAASAFNAIAAAENLLAPLENLKAWDSIVGRWPESADALFGLANARRRAGDVAGAASAFHNALEAAPEHAGARNNFADLLLMVGCPAVAGEVLKPLIPVQRDLSPALRAAVAETLAAASAAAESQSDQTCPPWGLHQ